MKAWEVFPFSSQMVSQCTCERDFLGHLVIPRFADMKIFLRVRFVNCVFPLYRFMSQLNHLYSTLLSFIFYAKSSVLAERNLQIDFFFMCVLVKNGRFVHSVDWSHCWIWHSIYPYSYPKLIFWPTHHLFLRLLYFLFPWPGAAPDFFFNGIIPKLLTWMPAQRWLSVWPWIKRQSCQVWCRLRQRMGLSQASLCLELSPYTNQAAWVVQI